MKKLKVLFVLENYLPHIGGVEVVFRTLAEGLAKKGHDVKIVTHRLKNTSKYEIINGVRVFRVNCFHSRYWFTFLSVPLVMGIAKNSDIIHTTTFNGAFPAWLASKMKKKPLVITVHEVWIKKWRELTDMGWLSAFVHDILERFIYVLKYDKYAAVSNSTKKQLLDIGIKEDKINVVYNAVDYGHFVSHLYDAKSIRERFGLNDKFVYFGYGRPGVSKGFEYLIKAVPLIKERIPESRLFLVLSTDKAYRKKYRQLLKLIDELGIKKDVVVHPPVSYTELPKYIKMADCVVVPSLAEGFGFTAAESCAMEKPVVAANTTSLPEVVSGKYLLVEPKNPGAIAKAVCMIHDGKCNRTAIKHFKKEDNIKSYLEVYDELLHSLQ